MTDSWTIEEQHYLPNRLKARETLFSQANGYLGIRAYPEEGFPGPRTIPERVEKPGDGLMHQYAAMVFDHSPVTGNTMVNLPTMRLTWIDLNGEALNLATGHIFDFRQRLLMREGLTERSFTWRSPLGFDTALCFQSFLSWPRKHVLCTRIRITPLNWSGPVALTQVTDHTGGTMEQHHLRPNSCTELENGFAVRLTTKTSGIDVVVVRGFGTPCRLESLVKRQKGGQQTGHVEAEKGRPLLVDQYAIVTTSLDQGTTDAPGIRAEQILTECRALGFDRLASEQAEAWTSLWKQGDLRVDTDEDGLQGRIRFHLYQLLQAYRAGNPALSIGAKFLSGQHYGGHYFWDTEIFLLPFYLYTQPAAARDLLQHRIDRLDGAREKARKMGYAGAFYPWEGDPLSGNENCPTWWRDASATEPVRVWCGEIELHINAAILYGLDQYRKVTGDTGFWFASAAPVVLESARFLASRGVWLDGTFQILDVIGPDEYHEHVNNDAYTNWTTAWIMRMALELLDQTPAERRAALIHQLSITDEEQAEWARIAQQIKLTIHPESGILEQDDAYLSWPVIPEERIDRSNRQYTFYKPHELSELHMIKQASVLALHHLFPTAFDPSLMRRNWNFYEPRTMHDSSLSCGSHAILAAWLGEETASMRFYQQILNEDLSPDCGHPEDGFHAANAGNAWLVPATGFAGLSATEEALLIAPHLPKGWKSIQLRIYYRFRALDIKVTPVEISISSEEGAPCTLILEGTSYLLPGHTTKITHPRKN